MSMRQNFKFNISAFFKRRQVQLCLRPIKSKYQKMAMELKKELGNDIGSKSRTRSACGLSELSRHIRTRSTSIKWKFSSCTINNQKPNRKHYGTHKPKLNIWANKSILNKKTVRVPLVGKNRRRESLHSISTDVSSIRSVIWNKGHRPSRVLNRKTILSQKGKMSLDSEPYPYLSISESMNYSQQLSAYSNIGMKHDKVYGNNQQSLSKSIGCGDSDYDSTTLMSDYNDIHETLVPRLKISIIQDGSSPSKIW